MSIRQLALANSRDQQETAKNDCNPSAGLRHSGVDQIVHLVGGHQEVRIGLLGKDVDRLEFRTRFGDEPQEEAAAGWIDRVEIPGKMAGSRTLGNAKLVGARWN